YKTRMSCRKIPSPVNCRVCLVGEAFFFASVFLTLIKEMKSPKAKASDFCTYGFGFGFPIERESSGFRPLRGRGHFLEKRQKSETKENALCQQQSRQFTGEGIFLRDILSHRKTPHIHVRRPPGLQTCGVASGSSEAMDQDQGQGQKRCSGQNKSPCSDGFLGATNCVASSSGNRSNPKRRQARAKRAAIRSANGPSPRIRLPNCAS